MRLVFGLDGGGTRARLRLADLGNRVLWEGEGEGVNPNAIGPELLERRLAELFGRAMAAAGAAPADFAAGCLGVAGADREEERALLRSILGRLGLGCPVELTADPDVALVGGLGSEEGLILIAGTGSVALARLSDGTRLRAGGYGHYLSDEGSGFYLGFQAIARCMRSMEGRDLPTSMMGPLLERFGLADPSGFIGLVYRRFDKAAIAGAAGIVLEAAAAGDPLASSIADRAAEELALLVSSVWKRVEDRIAHRAVLLWGGLFEHAPAMKADTASRIASSCPGLVPTKPVGTGTEGACALALAALRRR